VSLLKIVANQVKNSVKATREYVRSRTEFALYRDENDAMGEILIAGGRFESKRSPGPQKEVYKKA
jgi:hypothetical protein